MLPKPVNSTKDSSPISANNKLIVILLAAILITQVLILLRMPAPFPTLGALRNAKTDKVRIKKILSIPMVQVYGGSIDVQNTPLDVNVQNTPDVNVQNTPLEVEVYQ